MFYIENDMVVDMIVKDTISLVNRIELVKCKKYLKELGVKNYSKLNASDTRECLVKMLKLQDKEYVLKIYIENKVRLDMFKYEVCEVLGISIYKFNQEKENFIISGVQSVKAGGKTQECSKFCRIYIYEKMLCL